MIEEMRRVKQMVRETIVYLDAKRDWRRKRWLISRQSCLDFINNKPIDCGIIMRDAKKKIKKVRQDVAEEIADDLTRGLIDLEN